MIHMKEKLVKLKKMLITKILEQQLQYILIHKLQLKKVFFLQI